MSGSMNNSIRSGPDQTPLSVWISKSPYLVALAFMAVGFTILAAAALIVSWLLGAVRDIHDSFVFSEKS